MEVGRVAVEPAEVLRVGRLHVVVHRAVVGAHRPVVGELGRELDLFGDLDRREAVVGEPECLVVDVAVAVAGLGEHLEHPVVAPHRPVVHAVHHLDTVAPPVDQLLQVLRPRLRVADRRAAQRVGVVQRVAAVLGRAHRCQLLDVPVHLGRRLGVRSELELEVQAVDVHPLAGLGDRVGRRDQRHGAVRGGHPEAGADLTGGAGWEHVAVHVAGPPTHRVAGEHVLGNGGLEETDRRDDHHLAGLHVVLGDHAANAAVVIDVAVRVHDGDHRLARAVLEVEVHRRARGLHRDQRVEHDQPAVALDDRQVRQVRRTHLVQPIDDLVQPALDDELGLTPQARVHRVRGLRRLVGEEREPRQVPHDLPGAVRDHAVIGQRRDEPSAASSKSRRSGVASRRVRTSRAATLRACNRRRSPAQHHPRWPRCSIIVCNRDGLAVDPWG